MSSRPIGWRAAFVVGGLLVMAGGSQHPVGSMAEMLVDPTWIPAHAAIALGFLVLTVGLALYRRVPDLPPKTRKWAGLAFFASVLQTVEAIMHAVSAVDAAPFAAGDSTPVFTTHVWMAVAFYSVYAVAVAGLILAGVRERSLGSPWIAWIGWIGAAAHGTVMWLVWGLDMGRFAFLFALVALVALWFVLAGLWPRRTARAAGPPVDLASRAADAT